MSELTQRQLRDRIDELEIEEERLRCLLLGPGNYYRSENQSMRDQFWQIHNQLVHLVNQAREVGIEPGPAESAPL
jgi:hypothetical protein